LMLFSLKWEAKDLVLAVVVPWLVLMSK